MKTGKIIIATLIIIFLASPALSQSITLVTVGDSLTVGDGDDGSGGGYPARLLTMLQTDYPGSTLSNRAISGDTTQDLINKQLTDAVSDLNAAPVGNLKIAIIWIGSNDLFGLYASDVCTEYYPDLPTCEQTEMAISYDNVNTILNTIKATGATVYIALLDDQTKRPVIADVSLRNETFPGITDEEVPRMSAQIINYNNQVKTHASTHGATTVDFFNTTIFENTSTLSSDGNHPNGAGYDAIAQIWYEALTGGGSSVISLSAGWNLISLYKQPADTAIGSVLAAISGKYISVWAYIDGSWKVYDPNNPGFSDLTTMEGGRGYWINMKEAVTLSFSGSDPSASILLAGGWNLVGYNSPTARAVADAMASIYGKYVSVWAYTDGSWKVYDPNNPGFSDLITMDPCYGYWINTTEACAWTLP